MKKTTRLEFDKLYQQGPDALFALIQRLENQLSINSQNSHLPPSRENFRSRSRSERQKSDKKPGGQPGHPGTTRVLTETPDEIVNHTPETCNNCGSDVRTQPILKVSRRQVIDLPPLTFITTEHRAVTVCCPSCRSTVQGTFPDNMTQPVQYGSNILALGVYLKQYQLLPYARISEMLRDLFGTGPSAGTLYQASMLCAENLITTEKEIKDRLQHASTAHADETGVKIAKKGHWIHVFSTNKLTHYGCHAQRGKKAVQSINIIPKFQGTLVHDAWATYWKYACEHSLCNAHTLRELTAISEQAQQAWAAEMHQFLREEYKEKKGRNAAGEERITATVYEEKCQRYRAIVQKGLGENTPQQRAETDKKRGRIKQTPAHNLLMRLKNHEQEILTFIREVDVPFDNNQAERDLRMIKVQQKISGTFRDEGSAVAFCRIRGYISTVQKNTKNVMSALEQAMRNPPNLSTLLT